MRLDVRILSNIGVSRPVRPHALQLDMPEACSVDDVLLRLGVSDDPAAVALVNGRRCTGPTELSDGDRVVLVRPVAGG